MSGWYYTVGFVLISIGSVVASDDGQLQDARRQTPLPPAESLQLIELQGSDRALLLASEPQVIDPVEVAFDDSGRMWVVEMRDYPFRTSDQKHGQIVVLSDNDDDGLYESSKVFADQLDMPTGLALWGQGVVATVAGQLIYLTDTDGDGRADRRQVWLEGFSQENEQLRANHPRLGPDGWWYIACGLRGGAVQLGEDLRGSSPPAPMDIGSRDVRFHLATRTIELVTGPAQFGLTFDTLGHRMFCSNRNPATQVVFEQADIVGNPLAGLAPSIVDVVAAGEQSRVYPLVDAWVTSHLHSGQFTAACGLFARGLEDGRTDIFTCEPTGSLVHRQRSVCDGARLIPDANQALPDQHEWLASRDAWFRPVNVTVAPDGGMVVVDMHRAVIEHPEWVPEELKQRPDERWGNQAGRIVWIGSSANRSSVWRELRHSPLSTRDNLALIKLIGGDNAWLRQTSERLLLERITARASAAKLSELKSADASWSIEADMAVQSLLEDEMLSSQVRCAALRLKVLLSSVSGKAKPDRPADALTSGTAAVGAPSPLRLATLLKSDLGQQGLKAGDRDLAMVFLRMSRQYPELLSVHPDELLKLAASEADRGVRFEAWLCLGGQVENAESTIERTDIEQAVQSWAKDQDPYLLMAVASGLRGRPSELLEIWMASLNQGLELRSETSEQVVQIAQGLTAAALRQAEPWRTTEPDRYVQSLRPLLEQVLQSFAAPATTDGAKVPASEQFVSRLAALECLSALVKQPELRALVIPSTWEQLAGLAEAESQPNALRVAAIGVMADSSDRSMAERLAQLAARTTDPDLQGPVIQAWCALDAEAPNTVLLDRLASASPQLQRILLPLVASSEVRLAELAQRMEAGGMAPGQFGVAELVKLVERASGETKSQLQQQLSRIANSNRAQVVEQYKACLDLEPDVQHGIELFRKHCASCHRVGEIGVDVGPNISDSRSKQPLELLTSILNPNLAIDNNFFRFVVLTDEGRVIEGIIAEETADALVIRGQDDRRELIRREDIDTMKATGVSLMPDGLEAQIDPQAMADLIGFIKGWRYLDGAVPVSR